MNLIKKLLVRTLINGRIHRIEKTYNKKICSIPYENGSIDPGYAEKYRKRWETLSRRKLNTKWLSWYTQCSGTYSLDYVPESLYYSIIEPVLNCSEYASSYSDKNFYDLYYPEGIFPETLLRNIENSFYDKNYAPVLLSNNDQLIDLISESESVIVKPAIDSGGGINVELFSLAGNRFFNRTGKELTLDYLIRHYKSEFIIQKRLIQHSFLSQFNNTSVNTIKCFTYRSTETNLIEVLHMVLRVGIKDEIVDNSRAGGLSVGISKEGRLNTYAIKKDGKKMTKINDVDLLERSYFIPSIEEVKAIARAIAKKNIHHRLLSLDMTIDESGHVRCLEVNNMGSEINFFQLNNGPLFGTFTDEVINFCWKYRENRFKSYLI